DAVADPGAGNRTRQVDGIQSRWNGGLHVHSNRHRTTAPECVAWRCLGGLADWQRRECWKGGLDEKFMVCAWRPALPWTGIDKFDACATEEGMTAWIDVHGRRTGH